jgi:hypothetical protein
VGALSALLLIQAPLAGKAELLADLYGRTLGAAAFCPSIARERLDHVATVASDHLKALATTPAESAAIGARLADATARGGRDVASGAVTCAQAESELGNLAHDLGAGS